MVSNVPARAIERRPPSSGGILLLSFSFPLLSSSSFLSFLDREKTFDERAAASRWGGGGGDKQQHFRGFHSLSHPEAEEGETLSKTLCLTFDMNRFAFASLGLSPPSSVASSVNPCAGKEKRGRRRLLLFALRLGNCTWSEWGTLEKNTT